MTSAQPKTRVSNLYQIAYVTTDIDRAVHVFRDDYGLRDMLVMKNASVEAKTPRGCGAFTIHAAVVWAGATMYELIEPVSGPVGLYRDYLPVNGFGLVLHHFAFEVLGAREDWLRFRGELGRNRIFALEGPADYPVQFVYTDERKRLGVYHEYCWFGPDGQTRPD